MKTQPRKLYFGILVLGLGALGVDKFILGAGPQSVSASLANLALGEENAGAVTDIVKTVEALFSDASASSGSLAERLRDADLSGIDVGDVFACPEDWLAQGEAAVVAPSADQEDPVPSALSAPSHGLVLSSVMARPDGTGVAVVNGVPVSVGQEIQGYVLERVDQKSARFSGPAGVVELQVAIPGLTNPRNPNGAQAR